MKNIAVCYKWVRDDADIRITPSRQLDMEKAAFKISEYDKNAIEAGVRLKAAGGQSVIGLTCGPQCGASSKDALSRGLDSVVFSEEAVSENGAVARCLADMVKQQGDIDVIICSEGSADEYAQQTAPRLAVLLGWSCVTYAGKIEATADGLKIDRMLEDGVETVSVQGPVVISIIPAINEAPIPSVKAILAAKKKSATPVATAKQDMLYQLETVSVLAPEIIRKKIRLNPDGVSIADAVALLKKNLVSEDVL